MSCKLQTTVYSTVVSVANRRKQRIKPETELAVMSCQLTRPLIIQIALIHICLLRTEIVNW